MAIVEQLIRTESNGNLSFGNYQLAQKTKVEDFSHQGASYKVKTFSGITKLEKNGAFLYESVPGTSVNEFHMDDNGVEFVVSGKEDAQLTIGLMEDTTYTVFVGGEEVGEMKTIMGGKLSIGVELNEGTDVSVKIVK